MNNKLMLNYLADLSANNNREWYHEHKKENKIAFEQFEQLVQELINGIGTFDQSVLHNVPKELTFKLVRDTRFSHDKSPYNPAFRAHISSMGKLPIPVGYYIMIKPNGGTFLGGGLFADMFSNATTMVRDYIVEHSDEWNNIINSAEFKKYFTVKGTPAVSAVLIIEPKLCGSSIPSNINTNGSSFLDFASSNISSISQYSKGGTIAITP